MKTNSTIDTAKLGILLNELRLWIPRTRRTEATRCAVQVLPWPVGRPIRLSDAAICSSDQRPAMLRMTANASSVVAQPCSPVRGLRTRSSECWPPRQWIVSTTSRASSSTSTTMSVINVRSSCWRARIVTPGAFHAADRLSARVGEGARIDLDV